HTPPLLWCRVQTWLSFPFVRHAFFTIMSSSRGSTRSSERRQRWRWLAAIATAALLLFASVVAWLWWLSRQPPPFYAKAIMADTKRPGAEGDEFERRVLATRNAARRPGGWRLELTEDQINSWLAGRLPQAFPTALPSGFSDPRVALTDGRLELGGRYRAGQIDSIVSLELAMTVGDEPNLVSVRVIAVRLGRAPAPPSTWVEMAADAARRANVPLRWTQAGREPVALVTLPERSESWGNRRVRLESVTLAQGLLVLEGRTE
ncbi:MAG: hypothetical protein ACKO38_00640, partial [Planctomycetota bacterium]